MKHNAAQCSALQRNKAQYNTVQQVQLNRAQCSAVNSTITQ